MRVLIFLRKNNDLYPELSPKVLTQQFHRTRLFTPPGNFPELQQGESSMACLKKRNKTYYAQIYVTGQQRRVCLGTNNLQIAKEKLRQIETRQAMGSENPLPTRTPIGEIVERYIAHIRTLKTAKSAQTDIYYLREVFGNCCQAIQITSRTPSSKTKKRPVKLGLDGRHRLRCIAANHIEAVTTSDIQTFIDSQVRCKGLAPKTANRYREIICRLFNWAMMQDLIRMPNDRNPASRVQRHKERASQIRYLHVATDRRTAPLAMLQSALADHGSSVDLCGVTS